MDHQDSSADDDVPVNAPEQQTVARQPMSLRLSPMERAAIVRAAQNCGDTPCAFIRNHALTAAGQPARPRIVRRDALAQETARAVGQLGKIGSLLNQVAKVANATGRIAATDATYTFQRVSRELAATRLLLLDREGGARDAS